MATPSPGRLAGKVERRPVLQSENLSSNLIPNPLKMWPWTYDYGLSEPLHPCLCNGDYDPCPTGSCN